MSKDVFVFIEQRDNQLQKVGIELLGKARELADDLGQQVVAMLIGENVKQHAELLIHHGADKVIIVEDPILKEYVTEPYTKAIYNIIKKYDPEIVIYGASSIGRDLAPRLASRIHTGLTADCTKLEIDPETNSIKMYNANNKEIGSLKFIESYINGLTDYLPRFIMSRYAGDTLYDQVDISSGRIFIQSTLAGNRYSVLINPSYGIEFLKNNVTTKIYPNI